MTIGNSVTSIGNSAFWDCSGLTSVTIGNHVSNIGAAAFYGCNNIPSIIIPADVANIGYMAFTYCDSLAYALFKGRTLDQVKAMPKYPWDIDKSAIYAQSEAWPDTGEVWNGLIIERRNIDGGPYKETVDGIEWTYYVEDGKSSVHTID